MEIESYIAKYFVGQEAESGFEIDESIVSDKSCGLTGKRYTLLEKGGVFLLAVKDGCRRVECVTPILSVGENATEQPLHKEVIEKYNVQIKKLKRFYWVISGITVLLGLMGAIFMNLLQK